MVRRAGAFLLLIVTACSASGPAPLRRSPEPGRAPIATAPDGRVLVLGADDPEGVAVLSDGRTAVLATRRPGALVVVDLLTAQVRTIALPGAARHLQLQGDRVLAALEDVDSVATVDVATGTVTTVPVGDHPHDVVAVGGTVVVAEEDGTAIAFVQGGRVVGRVEHVNFPGGVAAAGDRAAAVEVRGRVLTVVDVAERRLVAKVPVGAGATHVVALDGDVVAVADTAGDAVYLVSLAGRPRVLRRVSVPGRPYGLAHDPVRHLLWVAGSADNRLHRLTEDGRETGSWATVQQPNSLAVVPGTGAVVVAGATNPGRLEVIVT